MLYDETWSVKEEEVIRLDRNDGRMVRKICNIRPEKRIFEDELRTRLKLNSVRECAQDRRLQWFGHVERMEESA